MLVIHRPHPTKRIFKRNVPPQFKRVLNSTEIRLVNFGSATFEDEYPPALV